MEDTYPPVAEFTTVRKMLAVAVQKDFLLEQLDVKTAFLHGTLDTDVYVRPPKGLFIWKETEALHLKKGLYDLKQSHRVWYNCFSEVMILMRFRKCASAECLFFSVVSGESVWLLLYVDDIIIVSKKQSSITTVKSALQTHLYIKALGRLNTFLGVQFQRRDTTAYLTQEHFVTQILRHFNLEVCNPVATQMAHNVFQNEYYLGVLVDRIKYQELLGCLLFLATRTRPDITLAISILCRHASQPYSAHWIALKRVLRYLKGTSSYGIGFKTTERPTCNAYSDVDWAGEVSSRESTSGMVILFGSSVLYWRTERQKCIALSRTEAEHMYMSDCCTKIIWIRSLLQDLHIVAHEPINLFNDNRGALVWSKEGVCNAKHVSVRRNFVKELRDKRTISLSHCATDNMVADVFTKPLSKEMFQTHVKRLSICPIQESNKEEGELK